MSDREEEPRQHVEAQPTPAWLCRLPIIRHMRWMLNTYRVNRHYANCWMYFGQFPVKAYLDYAVCDAIWRGEK